MTNGSDDTICYPFQFPDLLAFTSNGRSVCRLEPNICKTAQGKILYDAQLSWLCVSAYNFGIFACQVLTDILHQSAAKVFHLIIGYNCVWTVLIYIFILILSNDERFFCVGWCWLGEAAIRIGYLSVYDCTTLFNDKEIYVFNNLVLANTQYNLFLLNITWIIENLMLRMHIKVEYAFGVLARELLHLEQVTRWNYCVNEPLPSGQTVFWATFSVLVP